MLNWNYTNQIINPTSIVTITLSLTVSENTPAVGDFSFDATITATSN